MKYCTSCLMPSSRPRITFENGVCSACQWSEKKKAIDWDKRRKFFKTLIKKFIRRAETCEGKKPNVIVPWSGGKDSIYVAYKMKEFGLTPLLVTILPHLELPIGKWNREHTCEKFEHLYIALKDEKYRKLAKKYFVEQGRPKHPWETAISAVILSQADKLNIPLIVYGEEGEVEYGGDTTKDRWDKPVSKEYLMKYYWQDNLDWDIPDLSKVFFTQWSRFENWSPTEHWTFAKGKGMRDEPVRNVGTLWGNSQLSDKLQDLHMYLCFVKFGFGRCTADASIRIREGLLTREEAVKTVRHYDGEYPWDFHQDYLDYFGMDDREFWDIISKHADKKIVRWNPTYRKVVEHGKEVSHPWLLRNPIDSHTLSQMGTAYATNSPY